MGVVYLARQIELNRRVALKMLTGHYGAQELRRFLEEAETAAGLSHSNIAQIYEVGEHEGAPYFSMEYVENGSLADRLRKDLPPPEETARLLIEVARALHYAHQNHVVHRDMKPANVLLDQDGVPKIADFGIAKRLEDSSNLTASGAVIGTPTYMAPEQAKGTSRHVGPAADVYSLGAILYEMLAGRPPFLPDESETALMVRVLSEEPVSPAWHRPEIPRDLETICMKCLEKQPHNRYASAAALAEDLRRFLDDESILAKPPGTLGRGLKWVRRHPWKFVTSALLVVFLMASLMWLGRWILYARATTEYAASLQTSRGAIENDLRLTAGETARREISFRLTRAGLRGPVTRVEVMNPRGHLAAARELFNRDALPNWFEGIAGMQKEDERFQEAVAVNFTLNDGNVAEMTAVDRNHNIIWRIIYDHAGRSDDQLVRARFMNLRGYDIGLASHAEIERDATGRDMRVRFYSSSGQPKPNGEGVYGYSLERDSQGRVLRLINLGKEGQTDLNRLGVGGLAMEYDSKGQLLRTTYLGVDGQPKPYNGVSSITDDYDAAGNTLHLRFLDAGGKPVNSSARFASIDFTRNEHGETTELIRRRLKPDGTFDIASRMAIDYDANGYPSEVRSSGDIPERRQFTHDQVGNLTEERIVDLDGKPVAGAQGWSIRRKSYVATKDPPGWREEETYFDRNGANAYHKSGHHRTIVEFDQAGQLRLFVNDEHDPRRFGYYRYLSKPEFYAGGKLRRTVSRFEDKEGQLAANASLACTSIETEFDEEGREVTEVKRGCNVAELGSRVIRTDTEWYKNGARKHLVRQAYDENGKALSHISNGNAAHFEEDFAENAENDRPERIYETGFDQQLVGFSTREAKFSNGSLQSVTHKRSDGSTLPAVEVYIKFVVPEQPKAGELHPGDLLVAANGKPVTSAYAWVAADFGGGWIEVLREGRRIRIEGFRSGKLGVVLEDRAPGAKK
jgi:Protein kinase domain